MTGKYSTSSARLAAFAAAEVKKQFLMNKTFHLCDTSFKLLMMKISIQRKFLHFLFSCSNIIESYAMNASSLVVVVV